MVSAWRNFKYIFSRPLFTIIFRPEMLKFHPYSVLTGDTMVGFVIFCVLKGTKTIMKICNPKLVFYRFSRHPVPDCGNFFLTFGCMLWYLNLQRTMWPYGLKIGTMVSKKLQPKLRNSLLWVVKGNFWKAGCSYIIIIYEDIIWNYFFRPKVL